MLLLLLLLLPPPLRPAPDPGLPPGARRPLPRSSVAAPRGQEDRAGMYARSTLTQACIAPLPHSKTKQHRLGEARNVLSPSTALELHLHLHLTPTP